MTKTAQTTEKKGKVLEGTVVKTAMKDTVTVSVERYVKHPKYHKFMRLSKKYLVHNPGNTATIGDKVAIREVRPISKRKNFVIDATLAKVTAEEDVTSELRPVRARAEATSSSADTE